MRRRTLSLVPLAAAAVVAATSAPAALALSCPNVPVSQRVDEVDGAFIGRVLGERPDPSVTGGYLYRFSVLKPLKGADALGRQVDLKAPDRLVSTKDEPLLRYRNVDVGVMFTTEETTPATSSCLLAPPLDILAALDEPRGDAIKVVVGMVLLLLVLGFSLIRLKRNQRRRQSAGT